jgi:hypothetical protein
MTPGRSRSGAEPCDTPPAQPGGHPNKGKCRAHGRSDATDTGHDALHPLTQQRHELRQLRPAATNAAEADTAPKACGPEARAERDLHDA